MFIQTTLANPKIKPGWTYFHHNFNKDKFIRNLQLKSKSQIENKKNKKSKK